VRVWPKDVTTPDRKKHGVQTLPDDRVLAVKVDGKDPYLTWQLQEEKAVGIVRVTLNASVDGPFELFWSSLKCPIYSQACNQLVSGTRGRNTFDFFLDPKEPVRGVRLDFPEGEGETFQIETLELLERPVLDSPWLPRGDNGKADVTAEGLVLQAPARDPWLTVLTPGLAAERVNAVELILSGPTRSDDPAELPELFWEGPCGGIAQTCAKRFSRADAGALTHRLELSASDKWSGPIRLLRLDPGDAAGLYRVEHIALVHGDPE
jgi:hypothetical protein